VLTLGWTGGIATGKTTALELLGKIAHLDVFEADRLGHRLLREPWVRDAVVELCGRDVLDGGGEIDRLHVRRYNSVMGQATMWNSQPKGG